MSVLERVYLVTADTDDTVRETDRLASLLSGYYEVQKTSVSESDPLDPEGTVAVVVDCGRLDLAVVTALKQQLAVVRAERIPIIFVLAGEYRRSLTQALALGAAEVFFHPLDHDQFRQMVGELASRRIEVSWESLSRLQSGALKASLKVMEDTIRNAAEGEAINTGEIKGACDQIIEAVADGGLKGMMDAIRSHHNYTYRHSMMVCGYLTSFALMLGINGKDLQQLAICGLLHDIGKARLPLELLNKPSELTADEWAEMRKHPEHSRDIIRGSDLDPRVVSGIVHHHERIDGMGYPDGLKGSEVDDFARMVAIADVYSGLTEKRAYKPSWSPEKAWEKMNEMQGHLDPDLLRAFRPVAIPQAT